MATGVLPICIGPATRLDRYMVGHDKRYRVLIVFGCETTTDDAAGEPTVEGSIPQFVKDEEFAADFLSKTVGVHEQVPPQYSAIKVAGKKAYEVARKGGSIELEPRRVEVYSAQLVDVVVDGDGGVSWSVDFHVSKGTYIRALARDIGRNLTCPAHVGALERLEVGRIRLEDCMGIDTVESLQLQAALDPVRVLGLRFGFADETERLVASGNQLRAEQLKLYDAIPMKSQLDACACTSGICASVEQANDGELACVLVANKLKALYRFDAGKGIWKSECVFSVPVMRG